MIKIILMIIALLILIVNLLIIITIITITITVTIFVAAIFYPFSQFCENRWFPSKSVKSAQNSPKSISEGGRIWRVLY